MSKGPKREKVLNKNTLKTAKRLLRYVTDTYNADHSLYLSVFSLVQQLPYLYPCP